MTKTVKGNQHARTKLS